MIPDVLYRDHLKMTGYKIQKFPKSRIATNDVCAVGLQKHHITALIEMDVSESREKIKRQKELNKAVSLTGWLIKEIASTIKNFESVSGYLQGKRKIVVFDDINVSIIVEKDLNGQKVPIPLIIEKSNELSIESITRKINEAKDQKLTPKQIVLQKRSNRLEQFYYYLPGFVRRYFWRYMISRANFAFGKMGNVAITSIGMIGKVNGWFIPISVHPICFGIGRIQKKPIVIDDKVAIREILNMTVLLDHDVVDGAEMARFLSELTENIEKGSTL